MHLQTCTASVQICCVSCGKDMPSRLAIRHMESCFNKFESQTSFGSMYKTKIEGYQVSLLTARKATTPRVISNLVPADVLRFLQP